jgi:hypothetical protein
MQKCFMSRYLFYYPNIRKQQWLNEECLSLDPPMILRYLSTSGRYHKCWKWWCVKIVIFSPPQEMGKFPYFPLRYLSTSGRDHKCWKSWCLKIVSFSPSRNGEISLYSFEVFVNKWKASQVLRILVSKESLFFPLKKWGNFLIFLWVF